MELRAARERSGKTQAQVAKETGISEAQYQNIEYDKSEPRVRTAIRIARVLGSTVESLFGMTAPSGAKEADAEQVKSYDKDIIIRTKSQQCESKEESG